MAQVNCRVCGEPRVSLCDACAILVNDSRETGVSLRKGGILDERTRRYVAYRETSLEAWSERKHENS